jgi:hypothetical protein
MHAGASFLLPLPGWAQAHKVVSHLQRTATGPDAPFVWAKKVEKEIGEGKKLKDISIFSDKNRAQERLVRVRAVGGHFAIA